jgi:transcriptional regulator with XRE-family HTH domain
MKKCKNLSSYSAISESHSEQFKKIGIVIRELRFNYGLLTQKELAENCGVHFNTIQSIERGNKNYNLGSLLKIIEYFDYDLVTFIKELN